jgi:hypothetical protein
MSQKQGCTIYNFIVRILNDASNDITLIILWKGLGPKACQNEE